MVVAGIDDGRRSRVSGARRGLERSRVVVGFDGWESSAVRLPDFFATKGAWGSRYPNHDTSTPDEVIALCERYEVPMAAMRRLLGGNAADLFGLPVAAPA